MGLGAWAIGGGGWQAGWGPQDDAESVQAIHHAVGGGINWIDTAAAYGLGHAEEAPAGEEPHRGRAPAGDRRRAGLWAPRPGRGLDAGGPGVTGAIVGARRPDQVDDWVEAGSVPLGPAHLKEIAAVLDATGAGSGPTLPATA